MLDNLIPEPYRAFAIALAVVLLLGAVYGAGHSDGAKSVQAKWDSEKIIQLQAAHTAELNARAKEQAWMNKLNEANNAATERETKLRADYAAAHAAAVGLRNTVDSLRSQLSTASAESCRATANAALDVFGECEARYGEVAAAADGHANDAKTLIKAWPK